MSQKQTTCIVNERLTIEIMNYVIDDGYTKPHGVIQYIDYETKKLICQETWNTGMFVNSVKYPLQIPKKTDDHSPLFSFNYDAFKR